MKSLIDKVSDMIYVVDVDTYELLYINEAGKERFGIAEARGRMCYDVIYGAICKISIADFPWQAEGILQALVS